MGLSGTLTGNFVKAVKPMGDMKDVPAISQMMSDESTVITSKILYQNPATLVRPGAR